MAFHLKQIQEVLRWYEDRHEKIRQQGGLSKVLKMTK